MYANNLQVIKGTSSRLGIPLVLEKIEGPAESLTFLRITLDIMLMQALLPDDKLNQLRNEIAAWLSCKKEVKRLILSVGLLQHATKAVRQGEHLAPGCIKQQLTLKVFPHYKTYYQLLIRVEMVALLCHLLESYQFSPSQTTLLLQMHQVSGVVEQYLDSNGCNWHGQKTTHRRISWQRLSGGNVKFKCDTQEIVDTVNKCSF